MDYRSIQHTTTDNYRESTDRPLMRVRFLVPNQTAPVNWPIDKPYWCTGSSSDGNYVVAYVESLDELQRNWPDAFDIDVMDEDLTAIGYSSRMPKPDWLEPEALARARHEYAGFPVYGESGAFPYTPAGYADACRVSHKFATSVFDGKLSVEQMLFIHHVNIDVWRTPEHEREALLNTPADPALTPTRELHDALRSTIHRVVDFNCGGRSIEENQEFTAELMSGIGHVLQGDGVTTGYIVAPRAEPSLDLSLHLASYFSLINN